MAANPNMIARKPGHNRNAMIAMIIIFLVALLGGSAALAAFF